MRNVYFHKLIGITLLTVLCASCSTKDHKIPESGEWGKLIAQPLKSEKLEKKKLWDSKKPKHYRYKLRISCDCRFDTSQNQDQINLEVKFDWLILEIKNQYLISVKSFDGKMNTSYQSRVEYRDPMESIFEFMIGNGTENGYEKLFVIYDNKLGFPRFYLDTAEKGTSGTPFRFEIVEFENLDTE